jgi:hypothetical protein
MNVYSLFPAPLRHALFSIDHVDTVHNRRQYSPDHCIASVEQTYKRHVGPVKTGGAGSVNNTQAHVWDKLISQSIIFRSGLRLEHDERRNRVTMHLPDGERVKFRNTGVMVGPHGSVEIGNKELTQHFKPNGSFVLTRHRYRETITSLHVWRDGSVGREGDKPAGPEDRENPDGSVQWDGVRHVPFVSRRYVVAQA